MIPDWNTILEFFKVLLSVQMVTAIIIFVFMIRYHDEVKTLLTRRPIKLPGGVELLTPQLDKVKTEKPLTDEVSSEPSTASPPTAQAQEIETVKSLYQAERGRAYFWEYSYLNYFLVFRTQQVLDWLDTVTGPVSIALYDSFWTPMIPDPKERQAILSALERHHLIFIADELIKVNPKGHEYREWRGPIPAEMSNT